uniref:Protein preY, mitochondrial n=1 Tax=Leptobrachium leishanense TaxID=445787 RepID=A0A8C5MHW3_9ANUR
MMLRVAECWRLCEFFLRNQAGRRRALHATITRPSDQHGHRASAEFDPAILQYLVCPLSRKPLRYEESTKELINDELGISYPIVDGIPNMTPQDARMIRSDQKLQDTEDPQ